MNIIYRNYLNKKLIRSSSFFGFLIFFLTFGGTNISYSSNQKAPQTINLEYLKQKNDTEYILGPGDLIDISISSTLPKLTSQYLIDGDGKINLPRIDRVYVSGLTVKELIPLLNKKFEEFIKFPTVKISIKKYRPVRIYIDGEVESPGLYTLNNLLNTTNSSIIENEKFKTIYGINPTLFDAIRIAGGINENSDLSNVEVIRINSISNGGGKIKTSLNFLKMIENGYGKENIRIYDGDVIKIYKNDQNAVAQLSKAIKSNLNPLFIRVIVSGRVDKQGVYEMNKTSSLNDLIDMAGGLKTLRGNIIYKSFKGDGTVEKKNITYSKNAAPGSKRNPFLSNGDIVRVGKGTINHASEVLSEIFEPFGKVIQSYAVIKLLD